MSQQGQRLSNWGKKLVHRIWLIWPQLREMVLHRYLRQMVLATLLLAMLPCCVAFWSFLHYSMEELNSTNAVYYQQNAKTFSDAFVEVLDATRRHTAQISTDTRNPSRGAFQMQRDTLLESPINYYTIFTKQLSQYAIPCCQEWGVYYKTYDILFSGPLKYTLETYLAAYHLDTGTINTEMTQFFQNGAWTISLCPRYEENDGSLFVGIPAKMGIANDPVLFFYRLRADAIGLPAPSTPTGIDVQYALFDKEDSRLLFMSGTEHLSSRDLLSFYTSGQSTAHINGTEYSMFVDRDTSFQWNSVALFPTSQANGNAIRFYHNMQLLLFVVTLLLLLMLSMLIHVNYRPMRKTLDALGLNTYDEWASLQGAYSQMQGELLEHNQKILDLLLKNLLYNVPISSVNAARLGLLAHGNSYLVCVMGGTLNTNKRELLMEALLQEMNVIASITDILALNLTVIICRSEQPIDRDAMSVWCSEYFSNNLPKCPLPTVGVSVDNISLIHESYASCFTAISSDYVQESAETTVMPDPEDKKYGPRLAALKERVMEYLQENLGDCTLSQTSVADHFGVSVYSLSRLFKNQIGVGFTDYINTLRLEASRELLLQTDLSITEISEQVGFSNISYFSRLFKQMYTVSPTRYRKEQMDQPE